MISLSETLEQLGLAAEQRLIIAYSGGCDSQALLHQAAMLRDETGMKLSAVHINHGLTEHANQWAEFCEQQCTELNIPLAQHQLQLDPNKNGEDQARRGRYAFFQTQLGKDDVLLTAHHLNDQAETILLRLLRGAGARGLAAIPFKRRLGSGWVVRPFLSQTRADLVAYVQAHHLSWIEDESNQCISFDRNYLRHQILPVLEQRWPQSISTLAKSAQNLRETTALLSELGASDQSQCAAPDRASWLDQLVPLSLQKMQELSALRRENLIESWVADLGAYPLSKTQLREWLGQLDSATSAQAPTLRYAGLELSLYRGVIHCVAPEGKALALFISKGSDTVDVSVASSTVERSDSMLLSDLNDQLSIAYRRGGERLTLASKSFSQSLKKLLQEKQVPPWERNRLPMVLFGEEIIWTVWFGKSGTKVLDELNQVFEFELKRIS